MTGESRNEAMQHVLYGTGARPEASAKRNGVLYVLYRVGGRIRCTKYSDGGSVAVHVQCSPKEGWNCYWTHEV